MLIPPYSTQFKPSPYGKTLAEYIENTVICHKAEEVKQFIRCYWWNLLNKHIPIQEEIAYVFSSLLDNDELLQKVHIVSMTSWRNGVIGIRPNHIQYETSFDHPKDALNYYRSHFHVLFLYLHEEPVSFFNPSVSLDIESTNKKYFTQIKRTWKETYEKWKKQKIDMLFDQYNQELCNHNFSSAQKIMREIKDL